MNEEGEKILENDLVKYGKYEVTPKDRDVLLDLEKVIGEIVSEKYIPRKNGDVWYLNLEELGITDLPDSIGELKKLTRLSLFKNKLVTLPESIGDLELLESLELYGNDLTSIPASIGNLRSLKFLRLDNNDIDFLPETICKLENLERFLMVNNRIKELPNSMGNMKSLEELVLDNNEISDLPRSLSDLSRLETISADGNPLTEEAQGFLEHLRDRPSICQQCNAKVPRSEINTCMECKDQVCRKCYDSGASYCNGCSDDWDRRTR